LKVSIQKAKNGEETALVEGHFLHSNYAPVKEAERFVENLNLPYTPSALIILEPGLSYIADFLRQKFPSIKIVAIRYSNSFNSYNEKFDFVLNYYEHKDFEAYLEGSLTEEELLTAYFISWPAAGQIYKEEEGIVWEAIKASMQRAKTLLITRQYFEKKWFLNSCNFIKNLSNTVSLSKPVNKDVLIISSGPSLKAFLPLIKENQNKFFIICLSSAISLCLKKGIIPDLCMTTDGGYWAGQHLKALYKHSIPLAMPSEAYLPKKLFSKIDILPLDYGDGISNQLLKNEKLESKKALRNGTVSGTALFFAASYFTKNIFLSGLDMACQRGFQHAQPNELEYNSSIKDNRLSSKATRLAKAELTNGSLDIYRDWIINNPIKLENRKVFRLMEEENKKNSLGWISDISVNTFSSLIASMTDSSEIVFSKKPFKNNPAESLKLLENEENCEGWKRSLFPLDYVQLSHNPDNEEITKKINEEWQELKKKAEKIFL